MEVLYLYRGSDQSAQLQKSLGKRHRVRAVEGPLHKKMGSIHTDQVQIIITFVDSLISESILDQFPKLKLIATQSTGVDHIDIEACKTRKIAVTHVPGYGNTSVGELAVLLMLGVSRNIKSSMNQTRNGDFTRNDQLGFELKNKHLGVIGTGAIGAHVAKLARSIGMQVSLFDIKPNKKLAKDIAAPYVDTIPELLSQIDILTLHLPLVPSTRHMISYEELALMKEGSTIINTARGGIIYAPALWDSINSGHLHGAGLDVLELEQYLYTNQRASNLAHRKILKANQKLMHHSNVLHTLHLGAQTTEAKDVILDTTINNIKNFIAKKPTNLATK